jgi:two-component sensor histidine kinase
MIRDRNQTTLVVQSDDSITCADSSVSLGLIITELVINALKHAFPGNRDGRNLVDYRGCGPNWTLSVSDDGVGMPDNPDHAKPGLGTSIVQALAVQLSAHIDVIFANPGTPWSTLLFRSWWARARRARSKLAACATSALHSYSFTKIT